MTDILQSVSILFLLAAVILLGLSMIRTERIVREIIDCLESLRELDELQDNLEKAQGDLNDALLKRMDFIENRVAGLRAVVMPWTTEQAEAGKAAWGPLREVDSLSIFGSATFVKKEQPGTTNTFTEEKQNG